MSEDAGMSNIEREPCYSAGQRAIAAALDEAGAPRKVGTLSLNLVERVAVLDRDFRGAVDSLAADAEALAHAVSASLVHGEQSPLAGALSAYLEKHPWSDL